MTTSTLLLATEFSVTGVRFLEIQYSLAFFFFFFFLWSLWVIRNRMFFFIRFIGGILGQLCEPRTKPRLDYARMENVPKLTKDG
jgi:hypothetical protein